MREPRTQTILQHVTAALRLVKPLTERAFADAVVERYHERTALHERAVEFHSGATTDAYEAAARANAQILKRMILGEVRLPIDLEEAIVLSLPEPHRRRCLAALADRYDLLAVPRPQAGGEGQQLADLCREFGEAIERISPMLADGRIDANDRALAPAAVRELTEVITAASALIHQISTSTEPPKPTELRRVS